jgi:SAM-dependent methyltransferase
VSNDNDLTLQAYNDRIQEYVAANKSTVQGGLKAWIDKVLKLIPKGGRILELGSGYGRDATYMEALGYEVLRTDAAEGFIDLLRSQGHRAEKLNVLTDNFGVDYDLVFAHAVFLHFKPEDLKLILRKSFDCLKPGGVLAFSVKEGKGASWLDDYLQAPRYFYFWERPGLQKITKEAGFSTVEIIKRSGSRNNEWLHVTARK